MTDAWLPILVGLGLPAAIMSALLLRDRFLEARGRELVRPLAGAFPAAGGRRRRAGEGGRAP